MDDSRENLLAEIYEITMAGETTGARLVGIDGPAGSGKSTIAGELSARYGWPIVEIDDFFSWVSFDSWWPRFHSAVVEPLRAGRGIRYQVRDWVGDEFGEGLAGWKELEWAPVVIIEGVGSTRSAASGILSCRIWVDVPAKLRLERGVARDGESHRELWVEYMPREAAFFAADRTVQRADIRVGVAPDRT